MIKMAAILDLWVKHRSNYLKNPRNEFIDFKSHRNHKLHIPNVCGKSMEIQFLKNIFAVILHFWLQKIPHTLLREAWRVNFFLY